MTLLSIAAPWQLSLAASTQTSQTKAKKPKASAKRKRAPKVSAVPTKRLADFPEVKEAASVWRGCLEPLGLPKLALDLGVEESRLEPLLSDLGLLAKESTHCVPYVAATGGEAGAVSAIFQRPDPKPGESTILDVRKTADGITVTPGACDCPEPIRRVLDFPAQNANLQSSEMLDSVPANVRWQLDALLPEMFSKRADGTSSYVVRVALDRNGIEPERLKSVEILESASGKSVDGAWWLDRPGGPGVFIGMEGEAYERLLWQSPVKYLHKSRGMGPSTTTFRRRVAAPKGTNGKATVRSISVREYHLGTDLMAPKGTEVHTVGDAKVAFAGRMGGFGKLIILDHGLGYQTYYAHLSVIGSAIKVGARVSRGEVIGLVGSTGHSTAPHLHFETRKDGKFVDPFDNTREWDFWRLTPDDQERLAMELLAPTAAIATEETTLEKASKDNR